MQHCAGMGNGMGLIWGYSDVTTASDTMFLVNMKDVVIVRDVATGSGTQATLVAFPPFSVGQVQAIETKGGTGTVHLAGLGPGLPLCPPDVLTTFVSSSQ